MDTQPKLPVPLWRKVFLGLIAASLLVLICVILIGIFVPAPEDDFASPSPTTAPQPIPEGAAAPPLVSPSGDTPAGQLSPESLELLRLYHELQEFLGNREFLAFCYAPTSPAHEWGQRAIALHQSQDYLVVFREAGLGALEIRDWVGNIVRVGGEEKPPEPERLKRR